MVKVNPPPWSTTERAKLKTLVDKGFSAREIGVAMNRTKSMVIGQVRRTPGLNLAISLPPKPAMSSSQTARLVKLQAQAKTLIAKAHKLPDEGLPTHERIHPPEFPKPGHCKWIFGDVKAGDSYWCNRLAVEGESYCKSHFRASHERR